MSASSYPWYITYTAVLAGGVLTVYAMIVAKTVLIPLLFALFLAILLAPVSGWMERYKVPRIAAGLLTMVLATAALVGLGFFFYTQLASFAQDADQIQGRIEEMLTTVEPLMSEWFGIEGLVELGTLGTTAVEYLADNAADLARGLAGAASTITAAFLVPVFIFFLVISRSLLKEFVLRAFGQGDPERTKHVSRVAENVKRVVQQYITGMLIVIAILSVINSVMLLLVGVNHAVFFGVFAALLNVIPFIGPILGSILPVVYAFLTMDSLIYPAIILVSFYVIQLFESNLFTPTIVGSQVSMNALTTLLLLFLGAQVWGFAGMILFIPMGAMLKVVFDEVDALKPFGFVMGPLPSRREREKGPLARRISEIPSKIEAKREELERAKSSRTPTSKRKRRSKTPPSSSGDAPTPKEQGEHATTPDDSPTASQPPPAESGDKAQ